MKPDDKPQTIGQSDRPKKKTYSAPAPLKGAFDPKNRTAKTK